MKTLLTLIISGALVVSGFSQTRNVLVGTNNAVVQPTNFWSADASNARTGLGLGTAATNDASTFQPASSVLSNLASGGALTFSNITVGISNVMGLQTALDSKLGTNPTLSIGNISNLQTALDGKLGTNPTLQISNIFALQTALDGKLSGSFPIAISNVSGLQTALDGKLSTNPTLAIANVAGLQANLDSKLAITGNAVNLTNFPAHLLRATGDASGLTNFPTLNQNTTGTASNVTGVVAIANGGTGTNNAIGARQNLGLAWTGLTNTNAETFRIGLGATTIGSSLFTLANPSAIRFLRLNADNTASALSDSDFRTALGLGTAATNPASAFQASSANLTNLAANNGGSLTNLQATSLVGIIPSSNIATVNFSNVAGTLSIASGGTSATNAANARQNLGSTTVGDAVFIATNAAAARAVLGALSTSGDAINLTNFPTLLLRTNGNGAGLTNLTAANITGTVALASNVTGTIAISNGGSGATTAGGARTNLGLGATNNVEFLSVFSGGGLGISLEGGQFYDSDPTNVIFSMNGNWYTPITFTGSNTYIAFVDNANGAAISRTNLGLGWPALTNTTASGFQTALFGTNTNPVLVNTNGEVVSPTNFWQVAPIATLLQNSTPVFNATNAATNARLLFLFSLAPSTVGVTNTITLPTNGGTFNGDVATITHSGPTSSVTAVRQLGASTNIITLNQVDESVRFLYRNNQWTLMDNISYIEPIYFSGTNAAANAAASITNLGLDWISQGNSMLILTNTSIPARLYIGTTNASIYYNIGSQAIGIVSSGNEWQFRADGVFSTDGPIQFGSGPMALTNAAITRTNLGIPLAALTNTSVTNFQKAIFYTNTAPSNIGGNLGTIAAWIEIVASNGVTYKIPAYTNVP